jgi:hypothetical protein
MSAPQQPSAREAARAAGRAGAEELFADHDHDRATTARLEVWQRRRQQQEGARRRLAKRYGNEHEKRWIADPNGPSVDATSLLYAFLNKADHGPAAEIDQAPALERADALAAAHLIAVTRDDARRREISVMRQILTHGVSWDQLADALDTTVDELWESLRNEGERPDTWAVSAGTGDPG